MTFLLATSRETDPTTGDIRALSDGSRSSLTATLRRDFKALPLSFGLSAFGMRMQPSFRPMEVSEPDASPSFSG